MGIEASGIIREVYLLLAVWVVIIFTQQDQIYVIKQHWVQEQRNQH